MKPFNFTQYILNNPLLKEAEQQDVQLLFKVQGADKPIPVDFDASFEPDAANKPGGVEFYNIKLVPKGANAKYVDPSAEYSMEYNKTKDSFSFQTPVFIQDKAHLYQTTPSFTDWLAGKIDSINTGEGSDMKGKSKYNGQTIANTVATMMQKGVVNPIQEAESIESPEKAVQKVMPLVSKMENSPKLDAIAKKIAADPNLVAQLEKALQKGGVQADINESHGGLDSADMKKLALNFAKKTQQVQERISSDPDADTSSAGLSMGSAVVGGTIGGLAKGLVLSVVPAASSLFAGPAVVGAAMGIALFLIARKVYLKMNPDA